MQTATSVDLLSRYRHIRLQSEQICAPLATEDYVVQPITDVSPPKWHLGHTTWFFENFLLIPHFPGYKVFNAAYPYFFNSYYESQGPRIHRSNRGNMTRPSVEEVYQFRQYVDLHLLELIEQLQKRTDQAAQEALFILEVGLQHEQQHQELLLTDIKYILGNNPLFPVYAAGESTTEAIPTRPAEWIEMAAGLYAIGHQSDDFCWDNELSAHQVYLQDYAIQDRLITNGEYLEFMEAGGYEHYDHWLAEGWDWAKQLECKAPLYWFQQDGQWFNYTLQGLRPLNIEEPVCHVSYFEADAFARWKGLRLPTEQEWEAACRLTEPLIRGNFLEQKKGHPQSIGQTPATQFLGDVWEWTASAYLPYPHYPRFKGALGEYNGKFMINQMVLRGGSVATPQSHMRMTYRNFFQTDKRWQFTGIRLAR